MGAIPDLWCRCADCLLTAALWSGELWCGGTALVDGMLALPFFRRSSACTSMPIFDPTVSSVCRSGIVNLRRELSGANLSLIEAFLAKSFYNEASDTHLLRCGGSAGGSAAFLHCVLSWSRAVLCIRFCVRGRQPGLACSSVYVLRRWHISKTKEFGKT